MKIRRWDPASGELTLDTVKQLYQAKSARVSERAYPSGAIVPGRTKRATLYVARGSCTLTSAGAHALTAGDILDLAAGDYTLQVTGTEECHLIFAWDLRPHLN